MNSTAISILLDGPLKGERELPEVRAYWWFELSTGKWAYYRLKVRNAKPSQIIDGKHTSPKKWDSKVKKKAVRSITYAAAYEFINEQPATDPSITVFKKWFARRWPNRNL